MRCLQILLLSSVPVAVFGADATSSARAVDYVGQIQPLLESRCLDCHGPAKQKSGLRVDTRAPMLKGGDSGKPAIVPGKSAESILVQRVLSSDPDEMMPPKGERLTPEQVALLKAWIDQGAKMPEALAGAETRHWAYAAPVRHPVPKVQSPDWCRNGMDFFVLERLEKEGLKPSPEADKATLLRRASLDLTGLPPTIEELDRFLNDKRKDAFEHAVDRLLDSPHYGERWARPWLDLARYADTQGYEKDNRRSIWPYRDWVIKAFNDNMPFDEFTVEQLAGDMLPEATPEQKVATGFHRNTMTNTEGGTDNEEFRYEAVVDRVNTTMAVWMGTTFACAQCHNHKYDPISMKEYYQVMAFLNNTADRDSDDESPTMKVFKPGQEQLWVKLRDAAKAAEKAYNAAAKKPEIAQAQAAWESSAAASLTNWSVLNPKEFASAGGATMTKTASKSIHATGKNPSNDTYTASVTLPPGKVTGFRLEVLESGPEKTLGRHPNGSFVLKKFEAQIEGRSEPLKFSTAVADYTQKGHDIQSVISGKGEGWAIGAADKKNRIRRNAYFTLAKPLDLAEETTVTFTLRHGNKFPEANVERFRLSATSSATVGPAPGLPEDVQTILLTAAGQRASKQEVRLKEYYLSIAPELKKEREAMAAAKKAEKDLYDSVPITSVLAELDKPRKTHRHIRGAYLTKGEEVSPGTPEAFNPFPKNQPLNRLGFARWLVDTNNPLTARVMMNRFWEQYFGRGIVETVEEFGKQGELPSHPELLDWLATEFMRVGWDMKAMHKLIVTSATYRQVSKVTPELLAKDPFNRLYARGPRVRLEAEMIRDQALTVSGLLSRKIGGPSVMPPQPEGLWQVVYSGDKWVTSPGEDKYRRGLYTFWRRTTPHPMMTAFDAPSREYCVLKRSRSNTPLQALNTLNDPAFVEAAQALARRVAAQPSADLEARMTYAFRACLSRTPTKGEIERLIKLFEEQLAHYKTDAKAAEKMATSEMGKAPAGADVSELAAWTVVANVLLNLDEMITKG